MTLTLSDNDPDSESREVSDDETEHILQSATAVGIAIREHIISSFV